MVIIIFFEENAKAFGYVHLIDCTRTFWLSPFEILRCRMVLIFYSCRDGRFRFELCSGSYVSIRRKSAFSKNVSS